MDEAKVKILYVGSIPTPPSKRCENVTRDSIMALLISCYFTKAKLQEMLNAADKGIAVTIAVNDEANTYNQNVVVSKAQTKDERDSKAPKVYYGNGGVVWTDGKVTLAPKKDAAQVAPATTEDDGLGLPF